MCREVSFFVFNGLFAVLKMTKMKNSTVKFQWNVVWPPYLWIYKKAALQKSSISRATEYNEIKKNKIEIN